MWRHRKKPRIIENKSENPRRSYTLPIVTWYFFGQIDTYILFLQHLYASIGVN